MKVNYDYFVKKFLPVFIFDSNEKIPHEEIIFYTHWENNGKNYISYYIMFPLNGEISKCPCIISSIHKHDVEWVTVCFSSDRIEWIYFFAHGSQGQYVYSDDIHYYRQTNRPIVYVALNSHALYPRPGTKIRCIGLANDNADGNGKVWLPETTKNIQFMPEPERTKKLKSKWYKNVPKRNYPWYKKFFCICWK